ncbi:MAG TPA: helix-turn-helix transcriptional regulator, partial [Rhodanobacteraceae bacterium]|nr:helix-turn-helix transcriptional regulator [Rhodanobacteraceae bacterium]
MSARRTGPRRVQPADRTIGTRLRALRLAKGLSQTALGKELGVTFQQVQKYEHGTNRISGSSLVTICKVLEIKPEELLGNGTGVF